MNQPVPSAFLLEKYLNDQCTAQEKEVVEKWYASINGKTDYLDSLSESEQIRLQKETFDYIKTQIEKKETRTKTFSPAFIWLSGIAASLLIGLGFYFLNQRSENISPIAASNIQKEVISDTIYFQNNEPRMVMHKLPDGSSVWMHADAAISYPKKFQNDKRTVTFSGEGFFDIAHDKTRPFLIQSGEVKIKVLGTRFNVKAREKQKMLEVSVVSGSVSVTAPGEKNTQEVILKPQQKAFFEPKSKRLTFFEIPSQTKKEIFEPVTIVFEETRLTSVIQQLEQRFETHILLVNPAMYNCKLTADFEQQSLPVILEMLCTSLEASYSMSENTILIDGNACK
ncbi:FecR family protein [Dyadobacter subterraneus]|uniref:FecR family protein n=1 Tax=Dyadobacter subterraneus TaxID=2773304 RepID=A0ABR9W7W3_9BACT|nr:FecR family protein [Dyadobacter subterraneus]MBE9461244.1 FecR family protein [Dyadobacter subterraneus]